jgi:hypothetical protein
MNKFTAQKWLSSVWVILSLIIATFLFVMSLNNKFEDKDEEAWKWFSQFCVPGITLMLTTFLAMTQHPDKKAATIDPFFYRLTMAISVFYLASLLITLLFIPFAPSALTLLARSNVFLTILQGIAMAAMALFFVKGD